MNELTKKKIRRSEEQWRTIIAEQVQSGESIQRFCRRRGIGYSTFGQWKSRLSRIASSVSSHSDFVEILTPVERLNAQWDVELALGEGIILRVARR